ncbi:atp3 gamma subunit of the F1 sector of mitochondrial F1F0 ATP synthase [Apophysomyces sp. BC1034]|nr:atp3 gamma subunit of the F1 sector of mitochondrial F1F0 ATP synthase [Apophysomyces sp. BC1021]KAG0189455.1 atp3 gamma subunit of the F1 sector of mitochondrial F1F0 ATP synthase [Apophysomyces sp. BC1034]
MFTASRIAARPAVAPLSNGIQARNMATLKEIQQRLKSVSNIEKITKSMKMIASTKVNKAQRSMEAARAFGVASNSLFENAETKAAEGGKTLYVAASSDRGLCGGIHSSVSKATRRALEKSPDAKVVVLGDKPKAQLSRAVRGNLVVSFNQIGKDVPTFAEASSVVDVIKAQGVEFDSANIVYNRFVSVISYEADSIPIYSEETFKASPNFAAYEIEDDVLANLQEFNFANSVYWALTEGHAAEMCAKRAAMENATKNAGEMITKLTMTFNRGRQAVITNELIDIITGASAL